MSEPTTEKLHTVSLAAARLLPEDWVVECVEGANFPADDPHHWMKFSSGVGGLPVIQVPCPDTPTALFIYLHEIGHVILGHLYMDDEGLTKIREEVEVMASFWAYSFMLAHGLEVPFISKVLAISLARTAAFTQLLFDAGYIKNR